MMQLEFQPTPETLKTLKRLERDTPKTFSKAYKAAVGRSLKAMRAAMKQHGGKYIPSFAPRQSITLQLNPGRKESGVLAIANRMRYQKTGPDSFYLSWVGTLGEWAAQKYQVGASYALSAGQRHYWHRRGLKDVPLMYERPARPVIDPLHTYIAQHFARYVLEAFEKYRRGAAKKGATLQ